MTSCTSRSGTGSAASCSARATRSSSPAATAGPLTRYFPELVASLKKALPKRCVVDGEIVIAGPNGLDFEALLQRIHPAESRVKRLAEETPASFVAFDLLAEGTKNLCATPFAQRRARLEKLLGGAGPGDPVQVTPQTSDPVQAADWLERFEGAGLDGVVAKSSDLTYRPGQRVMWKIKHERTADCVVAGYRDHKQDGVGSLVLGLYAEDGTLRHVGVCSGFSAKRRQELVAELKPFALGKKDTHPWQEHHWAGPTATRWKSDAELAMQPLRTELVVRGRLRPPPGRPVPPRHLVPPVAARPRPASLHLRTARGVAPIELAEVFGPGLRAPVGQTRRRSVAQ